MSSRGLALGDGKTSFDAHGSIPTDDRTFGYVPDFIWNFGPILGFWDFALVYSYGLSSHFLVHTIFVRDGERGRG